MKKIFISLYSVIKKEKHIIRFILLLFLIGTICGSLFVNFLSESDKKILLQQTTDFFNNIKSGSNLVYGISFFKKDIVNNLLQITGLYILGLSIIGVIVVIIIIFFKGFILGMTLSSIIFKYNVKGILGVVLYVFPLYIIKIGVYTFASLFVIYSSLKFLKAVLKKESINFKTFLGKYIFSYFISLLLIFSVSLLDSYITPFFLKIFITLIK